jgi:hypothetical protein
MTAPIGPVVRMKTVTQPRGVRLELEAVNNPRVQPFSYVIPGGDAQINDVREVLDEQLTDLRDVLPDLGEPITDFDRLVRAMRNLGLGLVYELLGSNAGNIERLRSFWRAAVPNWRWPSRTSPPVVDCLGDQAGMIPLELMPMFGMGAPPDSVDRAAFWALCREFVGLVCVVHRHLLPLSVVPVRPLRRDHAGRIPMRYLQHDGLRGAAEEYKWLTVTATGCVTLEGPFPTSDDKEPSIAQQIFDPSLLLAGGRRTLPDQIQHFSCHCYASPDVPPRKYEIELRGSGREVRVTLSELGTSKIGLVADAQDRVIPAPPAELPLVFMNACGSSQLRATSSISFPHLFLDNGNRGFIGSEISMPDDVATAFSRLVYQRLLIEAQPLGQALFGARTELLERYGNPLGLAYAAYAHPELQVEPVVSQMLQEVAS